MLESYMDSGIHRQIELLQLLHVDIEDIQDAPLKVINYPRGDIAVLPCVLVFPADGEWYQEGHGGYRTQERVFTVSVFVAKMGEGIQNEAIAKTITLLQRFGDLYTDFNTIELRSQNPQIILSVSLTDRVLDSGVTVIDYNNQSYHGFRYSVKLYEKG